MRETQQIQIMNLCQLKNQLQNRPLQRWGSAFLASTISLCLTTSAIAQTAPNTFPPNPLEPTEEPDPLLPRLAIERPLSPQEQSVLRTALDQLNNQAAAALRLGNAVEAFDLWNREIRLRRALGVVDEVNALSRIGAVAWRESQTTEVRLITQRLQQIQQEVEAQTPVNFSLLLTIAQAYQNVRAIDPAIVLYQKILAQAQQQGDRPTQQTALQALGDLHLAWFDYENAAAAYQQLYALAEAGGDRANQVTYLQQLAYIYQQGRQPEQAIATQQRLVSVYESQRQFQSIPSLKLAIGDSYQAINRPDLAATSYQEAFAVSRSTQQYGFAADALQRLADLYRSLERSDDALVVYQLLLDVRRQSYDTVGIINTYDQIGQLQRARGNAAGAIAAFQQGLQLAQPLNYKVSYFLAQIQELSQ